jgi:two-component system nitrogen regulation response regulator NtrX
MSEDVKHTVLVVDDEDRVRKTLAEHLKDEGFRVLEAKDTQGADKVLARESGGVDLLLVDVKMPGEDGVSFLKRHGEDLVGIVPIIMMSGHGTIELAVEAVQHGAFDFLEKGFTPERLTLTVGRALEMTKLRRQNRALREERSALHRMVGKSKAMRLLRESIKKAAPTPAKVLILGENGVGKELVARAIHDLSPRSDGPFVRLNCAAIPRDLVESELFGHEKGAFTGADAKKQGKVELAHTGTLFLDEVGDMSQEAQAKLLRALESNEYERVGGTQTLTFDSRIIAATNKDLKTEVSENRFRKDLFYRLNVIPIEVPALRERAEDVPPLIEHYLEYFRAEYGRPDIRISDAAVDVLSRYSWPGNVRELRNVVERLVIMAVGNEVSEEDVSALIESSPMEPAALRLTLKVDEGDGGEGHFKRLLDAAEKEILETELGRADWNVSQAARNLGIDRANLHRKMRRLGIERGGGSA